MSWNGSSMGVRGLNWKTFWGGCGYFLESYDVLWHTCVVSGFRKAKMHFIPHRQSSPGGQCLLRSVGEVSPRIENSIWCGWATQFLSGRLRCSWCRQNRKAEMKQRRLSPYSVLSYLLLAGIALYPPSGCLTARIVASCRDHQHLAPRRPGQCCMLSCRVSYLLQHWVQQFFTELHWCMH